MNAIDAINVAARMATQQSPVRPAATTAQTSAPTGAPNAFGDLFHTAAQQVTKLDNDAQSAVTGLLNGQGVEVHDAMIATQKSELAFQLALQVRNKAVSAYQTMMQMQF